MGTINAAESLGLGRDLGSLAPGKLADILLLDDLASVKISGVFTAGREVVRNGRLVLKIDSPEYPDFLRQSVKVKAPLEPADFTVRAEKAWSRVAVRVIEVRGDSLHMPEGRADLEVRDGLVQPDPGRDVLKIALVNANRLSGDIGQGFVRGFGLRQGALATTHNPFFHGLAVVGTNEEDMALAANVLVRAGGGQVAVAGGQVRALVELPLSGVLSDRPYRENIKGFEKLAVAARDLGCQLPSAFKTLGFTTATGNIGDLKLSDQGLVDIPRRRLTSLFVE
ncbi:MAG: adenine deaminase [Deltaproteobacteria bacterium]|nr:adenine deaminase [Deltaproteobacteria bacterium]